MSYRPVKIGDQVRLTGPEWEGYGPEFTIGSIVTVNKIIRGVPYADGVGSVGDSHGYLLEEDYACELVEKSPAEQLMESLEQFAEVASMVGGMAKKLEEQGFTPEQSRDIVAGFFRSVGSAGEQ